MRRLTIGADFRLATATFRRNKNLFATGYWVANTTSDNAGDSAAFGGRVDYPNDIWEMGADFQEVQKNYDPALGFTPRREYRRYTPEFRWNPRPNKHPVIRRFGFGAQPVLFTDLQNRKQSIDGNIQAFRLELHSGDIFEANVSPSYERLDQDFTIAPGVILPGGTDYEFLRYAVSMNTANRRVVALRPRMERGTFFSGERVEYALGLDLRPRTGVRINTTYEYNTVTLAEGRFDTRLIRLVADTQFSPFMYLVNNVQYDSVSEIAGWQSRFRWILTPGNDVFIVYTHNWVDALDPLNPGTSGFRTLDRRTAAKLVYTKRF